MPDGALIKFNNNNANVNVAGPNMIQMWSNGQYGFGIASSTLKYLSNQKHTFYYNPSTTNNVATNNGTLGMELNQSNLKVTGKVGVNNITPTYELDINGISHTGGQGFHSGRILDYYPLNSLTGFTSTGNGTASIENDYVRLNNNVSITSPSINIRGYTHFKENGTYNATSAGSNILGYTSQRILVKLNAKFYSQDTNSDTFVIKLLNNSNAVIGDIYKVYNSTQTDTIGFVPIVCDITPYLIENLHNIKILISCSTPGSGDYVFVKNLTICIDDSTPWYNFSAKQATFTDKLSIGNTNPSVTLDINATDAIKIPVGTTAQRPTSSGSSHYGYIRYNTQLSSYEGFGVGNVWGSLGGVKDVDQDTYISAETSAGADNDQLKFFTASTEKMIIGSSGNVGIGTTSPSELLHIYGAEKNILLQTPNNNQDNNNSILFQNSGGNFSWRIGRRYNSTINTSNSSNFVISGGGDNVDYENLPDRFTINEDGNVGIGTNTPDSKLDVNGNINITGTGLYKLDNVTLIENKNNAATPDIYANLRVLQNITLNNGMYINYGSSGTNAADLRLYANGTTQRMIIKADTGNIGIGTESPSEKLHVNNGGISVTGVHPDSDNFNRTTTRGVHIGNYGPSNDLYGHIQLVGGSSGSWIDWYDASSGNTDFGGRIRYASSGTLAGMGFYTNTSERIRISTGGNVGIGTTSPGTPLHVFSSASSADIFKITASNATGHSGIVLENTATSGGKFFIATTGTGWSAGTNKLIFGSSSPSSTNVKMTMDSTGNFGIGNTSPIAKLQVAGNVQLDLMPGFEQVGTLTIGRQDLPTYRRHSMTFYNASTQASNYMAFNLHDGSSSASAAPVERMRILGNGNVGIATNNPSKTLHVAGTSIIGSGVNNITPTGAIDPSIQCKDIVLHNNSNSDQMFIRRIGSAQYQMQTGNNSGQLHLQPYGGNVGIGTTSPARDLDLSTSGQITFGNSLGGNNTSKPGIFWHTNDNYGIYRTSGDWNSPNYQQLLLKWQTGIILDPMAGQHDKSHVGVIGGMAIGTNYYTTNSKSSSSNWNNGMIIEGNVGIGTTTPTSKLSVNATSNYDGITIYNSSNSNQLVAMRKNDNDSGYLNLYSGNISVISLVAKSGQSSYIINGGNFGIGTNAPSYKLDVTGDINFTGTLRKNGAEFSSGGGGTSADSWKDDENRIIDKDNADAPDGDLHDTGINVVYESFARDTTAAGTYRDAMYTKGWRGISWSNTDKWKTDYVELTGTKTLFSPTIDLTKYRHFIYNSTGNFTSSRILLKCLVRPRSQNVATQRTYIDIVKNNGSGDDLNGNTKVANLWQCHMDMDTGNYWQPAIIDLTPFIKTGILATSGTTNDYKFRIKFGLDNCDADEYFNIKHFAIMLDNTQPWWRNSSFIHQCTQGLIVGDSSSYTTANMTSTTSQNQSLLVEGNVGIGTSTPTQKLHVNNGGISVTGVHPDSDNFNRTTTRGVHIGNYGPSNDLYGHIQLVGGSSGSWIDWYDASSGNTDFGGRIRYASSGTLAGMGFYTNTSERIRISTGGNVGIGTTSPTAKLDVNGDINVAGTGKFKIDGNTILHNNGNATPCDIYADIRVIRNTFKGDGMWIGYDNNGGDAADLRFYANGTTQRMIIKADTGNVGIGTTSPGNKLVVSGQTDSTTFNATSDMRYKENICPLENPLEKICQIRGVNFNFIENEDENKQKHSGIIAQEVDKVIPEVICKKNDEKWTANYNSLIAYLIESVKALKKENDSIKKNNCEKDEKINNLENKIENMASDISAIKEMLKM